MDFQKVTVEFYQKDTNDDFSGTYIIDFENSIIKFTGDYLIIENNNGLGRVYPLRTVKSYKSVSQ